MCARVLVQRATGLLLIFAASKQDNLASAQVPASCEKALQEHAGDSQLLELRLSNGDKLRGHIVRATDSNVSLESNKKVQSRISGQSSNSEICLRHTYDVTGPRKRSNCSQSGTYKKCK